MGANTVGKEKKRKESRQKEAGVAVACRGHLIKDKPISLPERYICAKGQDTQVSAAAVLIKDKPINP